MQWELNSEDSKWARIARNNSPRAPYNMQLKTAAELKKTPPPPDESIFEVWSFLFFSAGMAVPRELQLQQIYYLI